MDSMDADVLWGSMVRPKFREMTLEEARSLDLMIKNYIPGTNTPHACFEETGEFKKPAYEADTVVICSPSADLSMQPTYRLYNSCTNGIKITMYDPSKDSWSDVSEELCPHNALHGVLYKIICRLEHDQNIHMAFPDKSER